MVISWIVAIGIILGVGDTLLNNKFGIGEKFLQGFSLLGPMMLSIAGVMAFAPSIAALISPVIVPLFRRLGLDPGAIGFIMGSDMGGYQLAMSLCEDETIGFMAGGITGGMFGGTMFFSIPLGYSLIGEQEKPFFSQGLLIGISAIPAGSVLAGLLLGLPAGTVLLNNLPILFFSATIGIGLKFFQEKMVAFMGVLAKLIEYMGILGIGIGCFTYLTGIDVIPHMLPILETMDIVCGVTITLFGMLPLIDLFIRVFDRGLERIAGRLSMDKESFTGIICTVASASPVFGMLKDMSPRGIVINSAWIVCCAALLGSQLGLVMSVAPQHVLPYLAGKLGAGVCAVVIAFMMTRGL